MMAALLLASLTPCFAQPYTPDSRTLLLDHLDDTFTPDEKLCTRPAKIQATGDFSGGRPTGGKFAPGKFGNALEMHGLMQMTYPTPGNVNLNAGSADFWVAFNFDAAETIKDPGKLSNQMFLTFWGPGASMVSMYSCLNRTCVGVWDASRQLVAYIAFNGIWKQGEWHHLELRWGRALELWCDGEKRDSAEWSGLFGPIGAKPEDLRITIGSHLGWSDVESEYSLDELRIQGPGGEQLPDSPLMTVCRMKPPTVDGKLEAQEWAGAVRRGILT